MDDVAAIFKGKSHNQLILLQQEVTKKLKGGEGIDVGRWRYHRVESPLLDNSARSPLYYGHQTSVLF
jgi:hypothetical protein